jgi:hypothetical protein
MAIYRIGARSDGPAQRGCWGLKLVECLSTRWGLMRANGPTQVWFKTSTA